MDSLSSPFTNHGRAGFEFSHAHGCCLSKAARLMEAFAYLCLVKRLKLDEVLWIESFGTT